MSAASLIAKAEAAGAVLPSALSERDKLERLVDVVWHGDADDWERNPWVRKLNQLWLDEAREALSTLAQQ